MCALVGDTTAPGALRNLSARGTLFETNARPPIGAVVALHHPIAGPIDATVTAHDHDGVCLRFAFGPASVAFTLAVLAADMQQLSSAA
jgi:hypothetical protein